MKTHSFSGNTSKFIFSQNRLENSEESPFQITGEDFDFSENKIGQTSGSLFSSVVLKAVCVLDTEESNYGGIKLFFFLK